VSISTPSFRTKLLLLATGVLLFAPVVHCVGDDPVTSSGSSSSGDAGGSPDAATSGDGGGSSSGGDAASDAGDPPPPSKGDALWGKIYPKTSTAFGVATDAAGNTYAALRFFGADVDFDGKKLTAVGAEDVALLKLDPSGKVVWAVAFGSDQQDLGFGVATDASGGVYVTGQFMGALLTGGPPGAIKSVNGTSVQGTGFVAKVRASDGGVEWLQAVSGAAGTATRCMSVGAGAGKVALGCETASNGVNVPGLGLQTRNGALGVDVLALRLDAATGNAEWMNRLGGFSVVTDAGTTGNDRLGGVAIDPVTGDVVVSGSLHSAQLADTKGSILLDKTGPVTSPNGFVAKLAAGDGKQIWTKLYGPPLGASSGYATAGPVAMSSKQVFVTGSFAGSVDFRKSTAAALGGADAFLLALDLGSGETQWQKRIGGTAPTGAEFGQTVAVDRWGQVAVGGQHVSANSTVESQALTGTRPANDQPLGGGSFFLVKCAPDGAVLYGKSFAPAVVSDATFPYGLAFAGDGSLRAVGFLQGSVSYDGKAPLSSEPFTANAIVLAFGP